MIPRRAPGDLSREMAPAGWMLLLPFALLFYSAASLECSQRPRNCTVQCYSASAELLCPHLIFTTDTALTVKVKQDKEVNFECIPGVSIDYEWLYGFSLGSVETFFSKNCPLPQKPLNIFLAELGIDQVSILYIINGSIEQNLSAEYFHNISGLSRLLLPSNGLTELPPQVFGEMSGLTHLDMKSNSLTEVSEELATLVNLTRLELGSNAIKHLKPGTFRNLGKLELLNMWGNQLNSLSRDMFEGLHSLTSLDISSNNLTTLSSDTFADLKNLRNISLVRNNLISLPENLFADTKQLQVMKVALNDKLENIPGKLLANLPSLEEVYMEQCKISVLPDDLFRGSVNIKKVNISGNKLVTLPELLFRDTVLLQHLDIHNNRLTTLPSTIFSSLGALQTLHLENNQLRNIEMSLFAALKDLDELHISNNSLESVHVQAFQEMKKLRVLKLSHNRLTFSALSTDAFGSTSPLQNCIWLEILDLSHNYVKEIFTDWMFNFKQLRELDLSYNNLTSLQAQELQFLSTSGLVVNLQYNNIIGIYLHGLELVTDQPDSSIHTPPIEVRLLGNPVQCHCGIYQMLRYIQKKMPPRVYKAIKLDVGNMTCTEPPAYAGIALTNLQTETFTCPLRKAPFRCIDECTCLLAPHDSSVIVNCTGVGFTEVPDNLLINHNRRRGPIEVLLEYNNLRSLPAHSFANYTNITKLSLSHNHISSIAGSALPKTLTYLKLDNNNLTTLNASLLEMFVNSTNLTLHNNPWDCECNSLDFFNFVQTNYMQVEFLSNVTCKDGRTIAHMKVQDLCPMVKMLIIGISTTIAVIGIFVGLAAALYFRYQKEVKVWLYAHNLCLWFVREEEIDKDKTYDAFVSYSHQDEEFVSSKLIPELENGSPPFKLCVHYRDWVAGEFITTQIARSVEDSRRTIVVLSTNFINSEWGRLEFRAAHKQALTDKLARVIVVVYGDLGSLDSLDAELRTYLSTNTYVKWGDPWFWDKLRYALPHPPKIPKKHLSRMADKLELIHCPLPSKATTPPTEVSKNPLEVIHNFSNKNSKITNEQNGCANGSFVKV